MDHSGPEITFQSCSTSRQGVWAFVSRMYLSLRASSIMEREKWPWLGGSFQTKQFSANVSVYSTKPTTLQMKEWAFEYKRGSGLGTTVSTMILPWSIQAHFIELRELFPQDTGWTLSGKTAKSKIQRRSYHSYLKVVINTGHLSASLIGDCSNLG